jgi:hypothetical protein
MSDPRSRHRLKRVHLLFAVLALIMGLGLWPPLAQAAFSCYSTNSKTCGLYMCCNTHCSTCYDTVTGDVYSSVCGEPDCWDTRN